VNRRFHSMEDFELTIALNGNNIPVTIHPHIQDDKTVYDVVMEGYSVSIFKDTLYTWTSDDPHGLSQADIESIGEQIQNVD
jgi:hypothetical protein